MGPTQRKCKGLFGMQICVGMEASFPLLYTCPVFGKLVTFARWKSFLSFLFFFVRILFIGSLMEKGVKEREKEGRCQICPLVAFGVLSGPFIPLWSLFPRLLVPSPCWRHHFSNERTTTLSLCLPPRCRQRHLRHFSRGRTPTLFFSSLTTMT